MGFSVRGIVAGMVCCVSAQAFAWGAKGHQTVNKAAAELMTSDAASFFQRNKEVLADMSTVPDFAWKKKGTYQQERALHFFQWDRYGKSPMAKSLAQFGAPEAIKGLGHDFVDENGSSVWRIGQIYGRMVVELKKKNWEGVLQMAGVMGHYVGDMSQPMHMTSDYDGQSINRRGVHSYFETSLVEPLSDVTLVSDAVRDGSATRQSLDQAVAYSTGAKLVAVQQMAVDEGIASYKDLDEVLAQFGDNNQDDVALKAHFAPLMGLGAATLAKLWDMAVLEAGVTSVPNQEIRRVAVPAWFPL